MTAIHKQTSSQEAGPHIRVFTAADLAAMPSDLPSGTVLYELDHGRLVAMTPPGDIHCAAELKIAVQLYLQGELPGHGKARSGDVGIILRRGPDRVVGADAVFIGKQSLPLRRSTEGYLETIPDLVVEVRSRNDSTPEVERKVGEYLAAGVRLVWVADPEAGIITRYRSGEQPQVVGARDTLTAEEIIPGFTLHVEDVFRE